MNVKNIENIYELSPMQQGILFHSLYAPDSGIYFVQFCCLLEGALDRSAFATAWQQAIARHPVLRTSFHWEEIEKSLQVVHRQGQVPLEQQDWRNLSPDEQQKQREAFLKTDRNRGFDLAQAPLMRLTLIRLAQETYLFIWSKHHLILDGWSSAKVLQEVFDSYESLCQGRDLSLPYSYPYGNYIAWLQQQDLSKAETFWQQKLKGFTVPTPLGIKGSGDRRASQEIRHSRHRLQLSSQTTAALQSFAKQHQLTLNTLIQGAWALLLSRYSGEEDVLFGSVVSGRPADLLGVESTIGLFINTLPVRVQVSAEENLLTWLQRLQNQQLELRQYEYSPLVQVQEWSEIPRGTALFESLVIFENYPVDESLQAPGRSLAVREVRSLEQPTYPLEITAALDKQLYLLADYDCCCFEADAIARMLGHLQTLLEGMCADPSRKLIDLPFLTKAERQQLLVTWNDTQTPIPDCCLHHLFEEQVQRSPNAIAVVFQEQQLTYQELNQKANQIARYLQKLGIKPEDKIGILLERSLDMVASILGVIKAGGTYLPLDPAYPSDRLTYLVQDAEVSLLLTKVSWQKQIPDTRVRWLCLDTEAGNISYERNENPTSQVTPENLAYVIYTSGSTGQPKGVAITHRSLVDRSQTLAQEYQIRESDRVLQFAALSFDVVAEELFPTWFGGATVVLRPEEAIASFAAFNQFIERERLTVLNLPASYWHEWVLALSQIKVKLPSCLRLTIVGSEKVLPERLAAWFALAGSQIDWCNAYGPTEATITTTLYKANRDRELANTVPIGRPLANTQIYLLDRHLQPVPIGVKGELYVGGLGLARGYLNRPQLTTQKFIPNPFEPGTRLYKTGDLARYLRDGNIEFLGRSDRQVKIRGFRLELGEIESILNSHEAVREAIVIAQGNRLVAYLVEGRGQEEKNRRGEQPFARTKVKSQKEGGGHEAEGRRGDLDSCDQQNISSPFFDELRRFLKQKLPDYAIPSAFVLLETIPLTSNGKIDYSSLPTPEQDRVTEPETFIAPSTPTEKILAEIWAQVLGVDRVGSRDNFFELGGHSLLAIQIISRIREAFQLELPLRTLFDLPTIAELAQKIETDKNERAESTEFAIAPVSRESYRRKG